MTAKASSASRASWMLSRPAAAPGDGEADDADDAVDDDETADDELAAGEASPPTRSPVGGFDVSRYRAMARTVGYWKRSEVRKGTPKVSPKLSARSTAETESPPRAKKPSSEGTYGR
jgi:hypothetical protein